MWKKLLMLFTFTFLFIFFIFFSLIKEKQQLDTYPISFANNFQKKQEFQNFLQNITYIKQKDLDNSLQTQQSSAGKQFKETERSNSFIEQNKIVHTNVKIKQRDRFNKPVTNETQEVLKFYNFSFEKNLITTFNANSPVTLLITSCNRFNLLKITLASFLQVNTFPLQKIIIIDDSEGINEQDIRECCIPKLYQEQTEIIINEKRLGHLRSQDKALKQVSTEFVYQTEDDYLFYQNPLVEQAVGVMKLNKQIVQVKNFEKRYLGPFYKKLRMTA